MTSAKNKNIELKIENKNIFKINEEVSIKNIQKDIIIQKLQETYDNIKDNKISEENKETLNIIFGNEKINYVNKKFSVNNLNKNQKEAVKKSLQTDKFHLIQGPPGTGKTHTIVEIIRQLYKNNNRILITTHTHIALDNIIERLTDIDDEQILRIGQKSQVTSKVIKYTMENQIKQHNMFDEIIEKEKLIADLSKNSLNFSATSNVSDTHESIISKIFSQIIKIKNNKITDDNLVSDGHTIDNTDRINELKLEIENIKKNIQSDILHTTKIFASTVLSSSSYLTKDIDFDYVIMDEASQVPVYLALIPLMKTTKFILIGDNKQLQPIQNNNSSYLLNKSIFNLLIDKYPDNFTFLNIQYRMNQEISDIASKLYYDGRLLTGDNVKNQKIILNNHKSFLLDDNPLSIIDTSNINFDESNVSGGCCNKYESEIILNLLSNLKCNGISLDEIGIITPYKKQKLYIQKLLRKNELNVECDTIYRFQGREKDVILVSFCKSSPKSLTKFQKNFLADENQLNVSITRSRKKLILIGNFDMIKSADNIKKLIDRISEENILYLQDIL
ncbi:AAA domain-containing protein [Methanosphaera sp. ISO3-F5]|uniref:AAA domain-containing protein n=1 Tax=Methanosphaera sp. ISO3-F5 TaxID=1452353 RepID=UPI002B259CA7|nr:AAA domain-containing protein [Methanosphaera sp. ISO3-F5]WQH63277.1 AAA domain-containing protein [Methanosphaera sp. ISO3-F5]